MDNNRKSEVKNLRKRSYQDFAEEIIGVEVRVVLHDGKPLIGRITVSEAQFRYVVKTLLEASMCKACSESEGVDNGA